MKKILAAFGVLLTISACSVSRVSTLEDTLKSSVQLGDYCSGTVIDDPDLSDGEQLTVLTAKHCISETEVIGTILTINTPVIIGNDYGKMEGTKVIIKDISKTSDLVLLQGLTADDHKLPKANVYGGLPTAGTPSFAFGYPRGESLTISFGYLGYIISNSFAPELSRSGRWQKTTNAVQGGSSGGGLFVETDNGFELIGTLTWGYRGDEGSSYWTPLDEVHGFLEENSGKSTS